MEKLIPTVQEDSVDQLPSSPALKRYCPECVDSSVTQCVEYQERHCRSNTLLGHSDRADAEDDSQVSWHAQSATPSVKLMN